MKLGIGICIFSGAELLKPTLLQLRHHADLIVGVYSLFSNDGTPAPKYLMPLLQKLKYEGLIDELIHHDFKCINTENALICQELDREKFVIAKDYCKVRGCTHFMGMDCDEFYISEQFKEAKKVAKSKGFSVCRLIDYIVSPLFQSRGFSNLHVPFIHNIKFQYEPRNFPVLLDQGRTVNVKEAFVISPKICAMHHMTCVRYNRIELMRKFEGHSHWNRLGEIKRNDYVNSLEEYAQQNYDELEKDQFGILEYWRTEFKKLYEETMNGNQTERT